MDVEPAKFTVNVRPLGKPKNEAFKLSLAATTEFSDLHLRICDHFGGGYVRLIYKGKQLPPTGVLSDVFLRPSATITVIHSSNESVQGVKSMAEDKLLRGPSSSASKYVGTPTKSDPKPTLFRSIKPLEGLPYEDHARELLEQLATHTGFYTAMKRRNWSVGVLAEMYPEGKVGKDPVCVMGFNVNAGAEIHLRLRTDDLQGFRPMYKIFEVLAHELAHNKHSDHGEEFKKLMLQIQTEAEMLDWNYSTGRTLATGETVANNVPGSRRRLQGILAEQRTRNMRIGTAANSRLIREAEERRRAEKEKEEKEREIAAKRSANTLPAVEEIRINADVKDAEKEDATAEGGDVKSKEVAHNSPCSCSNDHTGADFGDIEPVEEVRIEAPVVKPKADSAELTKLISFGIPRQLAVLSLRNSSNDVNLAADFAYRPIHVSVAPHNSALLEVLDALYRETIIATTNGEDYERALLALELYIGNVVRHPGVKRYARINAGNASFHRNVGRYSSAARYLKEAGFRFDSVENAFHAPDLAHGSNLENITKAKDAIHVRLLPLLRGQNIEKA